MGRPGYVEPPYSSSGSPAGGSAWLSVVLSHTVGRRRTSANQPRLALGFEAITLAVDLDHLAVVEQSIEHSGRQYTITGKGLVPCSKAQVACHDQ